MPATHDPGNVENAAKCFIPLENNPDVFTHLVQDLGASSALGFYDVYSIDEPSLLAMIPHPAYALIFITPAEVYHKRKRTDFPLGVTDKHDLPTYKGSGVTEPVIWYKQTIGNTCGLLALLHSVSNGEARSYVLPGSDLDILINTAVPFKQKERSQLLYDSAELERAHMKAAHKGDTIAVSSRDPCGFHFCSFVRGKDGHLWELEGGWNGPIDRGLIAEDSDMLSEEVLKLSIRPYLEAAKGGKGLSGELGFSIVALAPAET